MKDKDWPEIALATYLLAGVSLLAGGCLWSPLGWAFIVLLLLGPVIGGIIWLIFLLKN